MANSSRQSMQALVLHAVGDVRLEEVPKPDVEDGQVRVRIGFCGVCGSDIPRIFLKGTYHFPTVCGHEFAGVVDAFGAEVSDLTSGDPVVVFPLLWCGSCRACEVGEYAKCSDYDYLGSRSDGGFAEYVTAPRQNLIPIPDGVSLEEAAMTEPAAVALHALRRGKCGAGQTVVVFGAGPIGLMVGIWAQIMGAHQVLLFDVVEEKLALAKRLGLGFSFNSRDVEPSQVIEDLTDGQGAHVCVEAAGVPQTFTQALQATQRGGYTVILGNPAADVTLSASLISQLMRREINIVGTWNSDYSVFGSNDDWQTVLQAMASKTLNLKPLITHFVPLAEAFDMLQIMRNKTEFYAKVLVHPEDSR